MLALVVVEAVEAVNGPLQLPRALAHVEVRLFLHRPMRPLQLPQPLSVVCASVDRPDAFEPQVAAHGVRNPLVQGVSARYRLLNQWAGRPASEGAQPVAVLASGTAGLLLGGQRLGGFPSLVNADASQHGHHPRALRRAWVHR